MALINLNESQKLWHFNIVLVMILGILFIAKANPTSETFTCNVNKVCTLEQKYVLPPLNRTKKIKLNIGACLEPIEYYNSGKHGSWYTYNLGLDNREGKIIKLFKQSESREHSYNRTSQTGEKVFRQQIKDFNNYKKNPQIGFYTKSKAENGDFAFWLYFWVIFMTGLMIWNVFNANK